MSNEALAELSNRIQDLELSKSHSNAAVILEKERTEMLIALRNIMSALKLESSGVVGGGGSRKEIDALRAENEELKRVNAKQKYRIEHLTHNLRAVVDGNAKN